MSPARPRPQPRPDLSRSTGILLALLACEPPTGAPQTPVPPTPTAPPIATPPPPLIRSCPVDPLIIKSAKIQLDPRIALGDIAGVTWLFGYASGDAVIAHLAADGGLATFKAPLHNAGAAAVAGTKIWLYAGKQSDDLPARLTAIDVADPDRPVAGPVTPVTVGAKLDHAETLAVGTRRALLVTGHGDDRELVLLDTATRAPVRTPHPLGKNFKPIHAFCTDDRCAVVGIADEGGGPARRLVVVRTLADGALERELLAPDWIGQPHVAVQADHVIVAWPERDSYKLRALDREGRPRGPAVAVPWDSSRWIRHTNLLHGGAGVAVALGERDRWSVAAVGPDAAPGPLRELPGASRYFLVGAPLADGLAWVNLGGDVSYDEIGRGVMTHSWHAEAVGGFLPTTGDPPPPQPLDSGGGGGRGGFEPYVLVRPGAAAALVIPRGDADLSNDASITPLRRPCP